MTKLEQGFETVQVVHDYWDGPRSGVAEYDGRPHWFENIFNEQQDDYSDFFWLTPLNEEIFELAKQQAEMFLRWRQAFNRREVDLSTHPTLPGDRETYNRLAAVIKQEVVANTSRRFKRRGQLKRLGPPVEPSNISEFQVKWDSE